MVEGKNPILTLSSYTERVLVVLSSAMENGTGMSTLTLHTINRQTDKQVTNTKVQKYSFLLLFFKGVNKSPVAYS